MLMYFVALAVDYDGTLAEDGKVNAKTIDMLRHVKASGRKLVLVTGRELPELQALFPELDVFDLLVVENGALLYDPAKKEAIPLADPPPAEFIARLRDQGIAPLSVGRSVVATWEPNQTPVLNVIRDLGLDLQIIFNKGAVMVLPAGVNKASGLAQALARLGLSAHNVAGIGDAENDLSFLKICGCSVAVENAVPSVREIADIHVAPRGAGVIELCRSLLDTDLQLLGRAVPKARPLLGEFLTGGSVYLSPFETVMVMGSSGGGKSTTVTAVLEQIRDLSFQFCVIDPEGDYGDFDGAAVVGDPQNPPSVDAIMSLLQKPDVSVIVNLLAVDPADRPAFMTTFLPELTKLRAATGRPHWIVIDEAHHCFPSGMGTVPLTLPKELPAAIAVTVHPDSVAHDFLRSISVAIGVGDGSLEAISKFCETTARQSPVETEAKLEKGHVHLLGRDGLLHVVKVNRPKSRQKRHARKYAEGELSQDRSFYFRGPNNALNLRAQNLKIFVQMAAGLDDETWLHHLRRGDYSKWFRNAINDDVLADETGEIEATGGDAATTRDRIKQLVDRMYTAPARA
jgi:hydroxymethylpyrimidine pyrophosphatase-like HAD family hydrolase